jgi:hypothetical protein
MELSVSNAGGRREERLPLDVLVELHNELGDQILEADGLDLGPQGMAMRAAFIPPLGARLKCRFRCPPEGTPVLVDGEVVWAEQSGPRVGTFGMRFVELDTKSAVAIREYLEPEALEPEPAAPPPPRVATLNIDGLGAPIEADVRLSDAGRVVLEQELSFLKLGRGDVVDVPGRGKQRGRIGSIELRHGALDVPTLVFGILLDEAPEAARSPAAAREPAKLEPELRVAVQLAAAQAPGEEARAEDEPAVDTWPERPAFALEGQPSGERGDEVTVSAPGLDLAARELDNGEPEFVVRKPRRPRREPDATHEPVVRELRSEQDEADEFLELKKRLPPAALAGKRALVQWMVHARVLVLPWLASARAWFGGLREQGLASSRASLATLFARVRSWLAAQLERLKAMRAAQRTRQQQRTQAAPRVQRSQAVREPSSRPEPQKQQQPVRAVARNRRLYALGLASVGVALGVYALAPRSGADRIRVPHESLRPTPQLLADTSMPEAPAATLAPALTAPAPVAAAPVTASASAQPGLAEAAPAHGPAAPALDAPPNAANLTFGTADVSNGRTFVLRMSGPVQELEGDQRPDGFTVRVPGRLALDRASPIATSHRAVARAMILNRGDYAELTVDFLPGMAPKYRVIGKDNTIEVTLERQ